MLPHFIIIGAMKCGTSSLYQYLELHPEVGMSDVKEVDFFVKESNFSKGMEWYKARFQGNYKKYGEASPNYSKAHYFGGVPTRMHSVLPEVKLIYLVRDPVERIISHYTHNVADGREQQQITNIFKTLENNHYVMCSRYFWQLKHYLNFFSYEQILVINADDLKTKRRQTLRTIFHFIGVDSSYYTDRYEKEFHKTGKKRKRGKISRIFLETPLIKTVKKIIPEAVKNPVKKITRPAVNIPELDKNIEKRLKDFLSDDVHALRAFTGQPFEEWNI